MIESTEIIISNEEEIFDIDNDFFLNEETESRSRSNSIGSRPINSGVFPCEEKLTNKKIQDFLNESNYDNLVNFFVKNKYDIPSFLSNSNDYYDTSVYQHFNQFKKKLSKNTKIDDNFFNDFLLYIIKKNISFFPEYIDKATELIYFAISFFYEDKDIISFFDKFMLNINNILFYEYICLYIFHYEKYNNLYFNQFDEEKYKLFFKNHLQIYKVSKYDKYNFMHVILKLPIYIKNNIVVYPEYLNISQIKSSEFSIEDTD